MDSLNLAITQQALKLSNSAASSMEKFPVEASGQHIHIGCCIVPISLHVVIHSYIVICNIVCELIHCILTLLPCMFMLAAN